jgi:hypothetical protein
MVYDVNSVTLKYYRGKNRLVRRERCKLVFWRCWARTSTGTPIIPMEVQSKLPPGLCNVPSDSALVQSRFQNPEEECLSTYFVADLIYPTSERRFPYSALFEIWKEQEVSWSQVIRALRVMTHGRNIFSC